MLKIDKSKEICPDLHRGSPAHRESYVLKAFCGELALFDGFKAENDHKLSIRMCAFFSFVCWDLNVWLLLCYSQNNEERSQNSDIMCMKCYISYKGIAHCQGHSTHCNVPHGTGIHHYYTYAYSCWHWCCCCYLLTSNVVCDPHNLVEFMHKSLRSINFDASNFVLFFFKWKLILIFTFDTFRYPFRVMCLFYCYHQDGNLVSCVNLLVFDRVI